MPGFDGRGPCGRGTMTGRGLGRCGAALSPAAMDTTGEQPFQVPDRTRTIGPGLGRGGAPRGCGRGNGGGRSRGADNRQGQQR